MIALASIVSAIVASRVGGFGGPWLWNLDLPKLNHPLAVLYHEALLEGRLPLWSDRLGMGFPLYAEGQIGAFYPPNWLLFRFPPLVALDLVRVIHLALAGAGAGLIALRLTGSRAGAVVASVVAALSGGIVTKLEWTNMVEAYAWTPWVLLPLVRRARPTAGAVALAGLFFGVQALAGHPQVWTFTAAVAVVVAVATGRSIRALGTAAAVLAIGLAVGSSQLVPTAVLTPWSVRDEGLHDDDLFTTAATPFDPLLFAFANAFVRSGTTGWDLATAWYPDGSFALLDSNAYVGLPALALAALGVRSRRALPFALAALLLLLFPVVAAFRPGFWSDLPVLNGIRSPTRAYMIVDLALAILAGIGVAIAMRRAPVRAAILVMIAFAGWYGLVSALATTLPRTFEGLLLDFSWDVNLPPERVAGARDLALAAFAPRWPVMIELAIAAFSALALLLAVPRGAKGWTLAALAAIPLALLSPAANQLRGETEFSYAHHELVRAVAAERPHRFLTLDPPGWYPAMPDQLAAAGIRDLRMFSSLDLRATDELVRRAAGRDAEAAALRRMLGLDVLMTVGSACPGEIRARVRAERAEVCRAPDALRPPYWIPTAAAAPRPTRGLPFDPGELTFHPSLTLERARSATVERWTDAEARIVVDADEGGWLYVDRAWWPAWEITVDGTPAVVRRALGGHAILVGPGRHTVEERLQPREALLTPLAVFAVGGAFAIRRMRRMTVR